MPRLKPLLKKEKIKKELQVRSNGIVVKKPTSKSAWKSFERVASVFFGSKRVPLSGSNSGHNTQSDSMHSKLYLECKLRAKSAIYSLFKDTEDKAKFEKKIPVVAVKQKGTEGYLLVMRPEDLEKVAEERKKARENLAENK